MNRSQALVDAVVRDTGSSNTRILEALAAVPRERFLGPPPWLIAKAPTDGSRGAAYVETNDVADLYANVSVALDAGRQLFNGAPGTIALWLAALDPKPEDRAFHIGCGTGYYSAVLAKLVASVVAVDIDQSLIDQASEALADFENVSLLATDATAFAPASYDVGLAHVGLSVIPELWLERLSPRGGRLIVPLTIPMAPHLSKGIVLLITRDGEAYAARAIGFVIVYTSAGGADEDAKKRLAQSLMSADPKTITTLRRDAHEPGASCWLHEDRYCLSR